MDRKEFEAEIKKFVDIYCQDYNDGASYEIEPEEEGAEPRGTITIEMNGEPDLHVPLGVSYFYAHAGARREGVGINTWEDCYMELSPENFFAYLWAVNMKRLRELRDRNEKLEQMLKRVQEANA